MTEKISRIGFGCYRIDHRIPQHYNSLRKAIISGINLIDTSSNYSNGGSEKLVGKVVNDLTGEEIISRDNLIVVTKGGYIQGENYKIALEREKQNDPFPEVIKYGEGLWHCIHPDFLEDQITRQLERLDMDHIDVYLLHNPEYFLGWAKQNNKPHDEAVNEFYRRIKEAFLFLERKSAEGVIESYGVSSNTFPVPSAKYDFVSLERLIEIANEISPQNSFKFIQLPFNLVEAGAVTNQNQRNNSQTVLQLANEKGIEVLINRPLNAITSKGLVRLAEFKAEEINEKEFISQIRRVENMEQDISTEKLDEDLPADKMKNLKGFLTIGKMIHENWKYFGSIEHFNDTVEQFFFPRISYMMDHFEKQGDASVKEIFDEYIQEVYKLFNFVGNWYKLKADKRNQFFHRKINEMSDKKFHDLTLSQKAILLIGSVEGITCVLIGARREKYVNDTLPVMNMEKISNAEEIIKMISKEIEMASV